MLCLSRLPGQSIMIGDDIKVTVNHVRGDKVNLGITAPQGMIVHREEIYDIIQHQKGSDHADRRY